MNRIEFINRTCMDDMVRQSILETFWDQFMLVCELSDSVEEVIPMPIMAETGQIAFQMVYSEQECIEKLKSCIEANTVFTIYERQFRVTYQLGDCPYTITVMIS